MSKPLALRGEARDVALAEIQSVRALARGEETRSQLADLAASVEQGKVADESAALLESVLELGLQSGRIRALYGPGGEEAAVKTLRRLPRGCERGASADEVSSALQALVGHRLEGLRLSAIAPGAYTLMIEAGGIETLVRFDQLSARLTSVGT